MHKKIIELTAAPPKRDLVIITVEGGLRARSRLHDMGLVSGQKICLITINTGGPCLVKLDNRRLALGHGLARKVMVTVV